jgi:hypothetical protein
MKLLLKILAFNIIIFLFDAITIANDFRKLQNNAFSINEKLFFDVKYGFVLAGKATMSVAREKKIAGRDVYHIIFEVNSTKDFDKVYKVRDRYETYIDKEGLFPWRFEQHIREGKYSRDFSAVFDHRKLIARTPKGEYKIPKYVNDILSAFYYARTLNYDTMKVGDITRLQNFYKDKVYPLDVLYKGKDIVETKAGKFRCIVVEPIIVEGGLFKSEGNIQIWLTDDEIRMPVKVQTRIIIGAIDAELIKYEGLKTKPKSKIEK